MSEISYQNVPNFEELSIKKLWSHFRTNQTILKYMPDYAAGQQTEREFFFNILSTIYPKEFSELIQVAYKGRKLNNWKDEDNMIVIKKEMKDKIDAVLNYKSKYVFNLYILVSPGKEFSLLKKKETVRKILKERMIYTADLSIFANQSSLSVRRLIPTSWQEHIHSRRARDKIMEDIIIKEKKKTD